VLSDPDFLHSGDAAPSYRRCDVASRMFMDFTIAMGTQDHRLVGDADASACARHLPVILG
jgi:hypothetical protein